MTKMLRFIQIHILPPQLTLILLTIITYFGKKEVKKLQDDLNDYISVRHKELLEEKLRINVAIKAKKHRQDELDQAFINLDKDAPKEAKQMINEQLEECRNDIATLQTECDEIDAKIYDPDEVQEILEEVTNQLELLSDKMKSVDSWQKDQLVRKLVTNLQLSNKIRSLSDGRNLLSPYLTRL